MHSTNWDDLRYVLAVFETGSLSAAARRLGVNHATVLRRVSAFEQAHGGAIFERTKHGYSLLPDRKRVIDAARDAAAAMHSVERLMQGATAPLRGRVRISSTDSLCQHVLPAVCERLRHRFADLHVDLLSSNAHVDLARMQTDITVRPAMRLGDEMVGVAAGELGFAIYACDGADDDWLGLSGALARSAPAAWMDRHVAPEEIGSSADSFLVLRDLALRGLGRCFLPCFLGDAEAGLSRLDGPRVQVPVWVASHADRAEVPRLRAVRDEIIASLKGMSDRLAGEGGGTAQPVKLAGE